MIARRFCRNKKGQFMILVALGIVIMMITLASLLAYTTISPLSFSKTEFREVTTQVSLNFRRTLALSLACVSKELDFKASVRFYTAFTTLEDYPKAMDIGYEFLSDWQNTTLIRYPGLGLNLSISKPIFACEWNSFKGYSKASANMTLDILNYGFYGWKESTTVELNLTILDLKETDGNNTSFYFKLEKEYDEPLTGLTDSQLKILYQDGSGVYREAESIELTYFGSGNYLAGYVAFRSTTSDNLELLKTDINNMSDSEFKNATYKTSLLSKVDNVTEKYNAGNMTDAYGQLLTDIRPKLDPYDEGSWVVETADTKDILLLIDKILSQLVPKIKTIIQDTRGIIVGASASLIIPGEDEVGPKTLNVNASPNPTIGLDLITITAVIDDLATGWSNIVSAEYFIESTSPSGSGIPMAAIDGNFNSTPTEDVMAEINVTTWDIGSFTIYVHGKDAADNWGAFSSMELEVTETPMMHVGDIDMSIETRGSRWWRRSRAVALVTIVDSGGNPVEDASVYGHWSGATSGDVFGVTDMNGQFAFMSDWVFGGGTFTFTVDDVVLFGWIYDQGSNVETSDTITG